MDAFFSSVEQRDNERLRGRPVAVGGDGDRSVVAAASYEARRFGVKSAMPSSMAKRLCPDLVFVRPRFDVYREVSGWIRSIFLEYTDLVEPMSLDEAYLDVTQNHKGIRYARDIAAEIRERIRGETHLTASAGVSYCRFLAKMASDMRKPDGMYVIPPERGKDYVSSLPIRKFHGIGPATAEKMIALGINTGADLERMGREFLIDHFGKAGAYFHDLSLGIDNRLVNPNRIRKSIGAENTLDYDTIDAAVLCEELARLSDKVWDRCLNHGKAGRTATLKVKFEDFEEVSRSKTVLGAPFDRDTFAAISASLLEGLLPLEKAIRLVGVTMSGFENETEAASSPQLDLFA